MPCCPSRCACTACRDKAARWWLNPCGAPVPAPVPSRANPWCVPPTRLEGTLDASFCQVLLLRAYGPACQMTHKQPGRAQEPLRCQRGLCPVCALCQTARVGEPSTPVPAPPPRGRWFCCPAASNSQGWGPKDPKRPVGPPFPRSLCSARSPSGQVAPVSFPAASAMSVGCRHEEQWRCRAAALAAGKCGRPAQSSPAAWPCEGHWCPAIVLHRRFQLSASLVPVGWRSPAAACG